MDEFDERVTKIRCDKTDLSSNLTYSLSSLFVFFRFIAVDVY